MNMCSDFVFSPEVFCASHSGGIIQTKFLAQGLLRDCKCTCAYYMLYVCGSMTKNKGFVHLCIRIYE